LKFTVLTIHPELLNSFLGEGLLAKALEKKRVEIRIVNIRDYSDPPHHRVDDKPYGGGPGMVLKVEPIARAIQDCIQKGERSRVIVLAAKGKLFTQTHARRLQVKFDHLIFVCGRYEGIDERVAEFYADEELRIGNYVLMGGEVAASVVIEAVARLCRGVLGNSESLADESFSTPNKKEYEHYTRPPQFEGHEVPEVLMGGNHSEIRKWRKR